MKKEDYDLIADTIPRNPGIYKFINKEDEILYVGKAKILRNRVSSYFNAAGQIYNKTRVMVKNAHRIEFIIVDSEQDALLLENTLIKKHQPRYNVSLKDGKSYSYLCIRNERFPRVYFTRTVIKDGSLYFGPYTSKWRMKMIMEMVRKMFPLRTCNYALTEENIRRGKFKVCLEYHIKNCQGPCEGLESEESYNSKIEQIKNILRGHFGAVKHYLHERMHSHVDLLEFEQAHLIKEKLELFEDYQSKSTVVSATVQDVDVFTIAMDETEAFVNYLKVVNGMLINTYTLELEKNLDDDENTLLTYAVGLLRDRFQSIAPEILVPFKIPSSDENIKITIPQRGDKKRLLDLSEKNVNYFLLQNKKEKASRQPRETPAERILKTLQTDLQLSELPVHIECFDNSNMQGSNPVAACVVFKNAKPAKRDYRHFNIKTVVGPDDFASMEEIVYRRYKRMQDENTPLPQLVIIDGGKGQLSSAMNSIEKLGLVGKMTVVGIAKRLEEIFFPGDSIPLYINKKSESLKLIQQARNEAHRFAITFHRNQRSKNFIQTELSEIPGLGEKTIEKLLKAFKSVPNIKKASEEEIIKVAGKSMAKKLLEYYAAKNE